MTTRKPLTEWIDEYEHDPEFVAEGLAIDVTDEALNLLRENGKTQTWLAEQMGISRSRVSSIFTAPPNLTFLSLARLAVALNVKPKVILNWNRYATIQFANKPSISNEANGSGYDLEKRLKRPLASITANSGSGMDSGNATV